MDLGHLRREYSREPLELEQLDPDPLRQFQSWFQATIDAGVPEPNAMSLATVSAQGHPSLRTVLLKYFDEDGFVFFTNLQSRKAQEIAGNPRVALLFNWPARERQIEIQGTATKLSTAASLKYFATRPRGAQLGAWCSHQSQVVGSRQQLLAKLAEIKRKFKEGEVPLPSFWGGYQVAPAQIEFWQGGADRLHDRFLYTQVESSWRIERLSP